jgi:hypothetical protein
VLQRVARFDRLAVVLHDAARDVMQLHSIGALNPVVPTVIELPPPETPSGIACLTQPEPSIRRAPVFVFQASIRPRTAKRARPVPPTSPCIP